MQKGFYKHKNLGKVEITEACIYMQKHNPDLTSIFVEKDGNVLEVTKSLITEIKGATL